MLQFVPFNNSSYKWAARFRILRDNDTSIIEVDAPGLNRDKIAVGITGRRLSVTGEREMGHEGRTVKLILNEDFTLAETVNLDKVTTTYTDGVIRVTCPAVEKYTRSVQVD